MKRKSNILSNVLPIFISCLFVLAIIAGLVAVLKKFADGGFNKNSTKYLVLRRGFEPLYLTILPPEDSVSTDFTT